MKRLLLFVPGILLCFSGIAQNQTLPDVSVVSVTLAPVPIVKQPTILPDPNGTQQPAKSVASTNPNIKCTIVIHNALADAKNVTVTATIPRDATVISNGGGRQINPGNGNMVVYPEMVFPVGTMTAGQSVTVEFTFTKTVKNVVKAQVHCDVLPGRYDADPNNDVKTGVIY